jgi:DNA-binding MarR family transcriptional regulator
MLNGLIDTAARRRDFEWLQDLRAIERRHLSVFKTLTERNIACEIGYHQALGSPLTVKQLYLLGLAPVVTMHRHLQRLCKAGIVIRMQSKRDARVRELRLAPAGEEVFERLFAATARARGSVAALPDEEAAAWRREAGSGIPEMRSAPQFPVSGGFVREVDCSITRWEFIRDRENDSWTWRAIRMNDSIDRTSEPHAAFGNAVIDAMRHGFGAQSMHWVIAERDWCTHFEPGKPPLTIRRESDGLPRTRERARHAILAARAEREAAGTEADADEISRFLAQEAGSEARSRSYEGRDRS